MGHSPSFPAVQVAHTQSIHDPANDEPMHQLLVVKRIIKSKAREICDNARNTKHLHVAFAILS